MSKAVKLMMVTGSANNNKYYNMTELGDGNFKAEFGRVGASPQVATLPMGRWNAQYRSKITKGYKDITELFVEESTSSVDFSDISDYAIKSLVAKLQAYAKGEVARNYNVSAEKVTKKQTDEAQSLINGLVGLLKPNDINKILIDLYTVIPRKMSNVKDHLLLEFSAIDASIVNKLITKEQDLLDVMSSQIKQVELVKENVDSSLTILDAMGLTMENITSDEASLVKNKLSDIQHMYVNAFKVTNKKTQAKFDDFVAKAANKKKELFFHGSRNENWLSILGTGLVLRPTSAVISGKMFGYGTYFADKARKSLGYTSSRGSYWARGTSDEAYMALFDVHLGNMLQTKRRESWMGSLDEAQLKARGNYDSLFAEGGADLINNEYIVYHENQSTVKYIIQLKG